MAQHRVFQHTNGNIVVIDQECGLLLQYNEAGGQASVGALADDNGIMVRTFELSSDMQEIVLESEELVCLDEIGDRLNAIVSVVKSATQA